MNAFTLQGKRHLARTNSFSNQAGPLGGGLVPNNLQEE